MSCNCNTYKKGDELRIVKGNAFHLRVQVTARRMDGTIIDDFDLGEASPVLKVLYGGTGTETGMVVEGNEAVVYFNGNQVLGWYGLEMSGTWEGEAWRWCVEKVFQIVNTNAKANVPEWAFFTDDSYTIAGTFDLVAAAAAAVQSDWTETDPNSAAFILHKPDLSVYALKSEVGDVVHYSAQTLTDAQKRQARANIGAEESGDYVENLARSASAYTTLIKAGNDSGAKAEVRVQERSVKLEAEAGSVEVSQNGVAVTAGNSGFPDARMTLNGKEVATKDDVSAVSAQVEAVSEVANAAAPQATTYDKTEVDVKLAEKADKATTLAGYGITDAYTKQEVDDAIEAIDVSAQIAGKADKVAGAVTGDFAGLDAQGNLVDSGKKATDFATAAQGAKADAAAPQATTYNKTEVDAALAGKADKATTLSGYGIADAYTKQEVDSLIVPVGTEVKVVTALPATGVANTIYRVAGDPNAASYTDYGWNGTQFVALAVNAFSIDDAPTLGSVNAVMSNGVEQELMNRQFIHDGIITRRMLLSAARTNDNLFLNYKAGTYNITAKIPNSAETYVAIEFKEKETGTVKFSVSRIEPGSTVSIDGREISDDLDNIYLSIYTSSFAQVPYIDVEIEIVGNPWGMVSKNVDYINNLPGIINQESPTLTSGVQAWVKYTDHICAGSGAFRLYGFAVERTMFGIDAIITPSTDNYPAAISFYSAEVDISTGAKFNANSASLWLDGVQCHAGVSKYSSVIPVGAKYCVITTRSASVVPSVTIYSSSASAALANDISEIPQIKQDIADQGEYINAEKSYMREDVIVSPHMDDTASASNDSTYIRFFGRNSDGNAQYLNRYILGLRLFVSTIGGGTISIIKGSGIQSGATPSQYSYETLKTFNVKQGYNELYLDEPVVLTETTDYIGINGDCRILYYGDYTSPTNVGFYWANQNSDNILAWSNKDALVGVIASIIPVGIDEMKGLPESSINVLYLGSFADCPYYYHWSPNWFTDNIPSQSIEDNFLAKRLGFKFVEVNQQATATAGKYVVTHGVNGKFGDEFSDEYKDVSISSMSYDDIVANVKYNSDIACYNHTISTLDTFLANCAQLGLGVYLRTNSQDVVSCARKYLPDDKIIIPGGAGIRQSLQFYGLLTSYIGGSNSSEVCDVTYLRDFVEARGGAPYHLVMVGTHIDYMLSQGTLDNIVTSLRKEGIYIGGCYCSTASLEQLTAVGGIGHAADKGQINFFSDANVGAWSPLDADLSLWTIPEGIVVSGGKLINSTSNALTIYTPSTGQIALAKSQIQARVKGDVTFGCGLITSIPYTGNNEDKPINLNVAGIKSDMRLNIVIGANSSVEFLNYQVSRC